METDRRHRFESALETVASLPVGAAGPDDEHELSLLREALAYLDDHPEIAGGDPNGVFTYEHPVLALAAEAFHKGRALKVEAAGDGSELSKWAIIEWALVGVSRFRAILNDPRLNDLKDRIPSNAYTFEAPKLRLALLGDAGFAGTAQTKVLDMIRRRHDEEAFDLVVHLGDTYFGGTPEEMLESLLAPFRQKLPGCRIVTLCGNHDLYYGCGGYLSAIDVLQQKGRYFAVENPFWRIACLDTSFAARDFRRDDGLLDDEQLEWLKALASSSARKPLVLLSHHYIRSHWHTPIESLRRQLADWAKENVFAWYWGHEHHFAAYSTNGFGYYGSCVGNGAFLETWSPSRAERPDAPNWHAPKGCDCYGNKGLNAWPHGFLELEWGPNAILETYHFEGGEPYRRTLPRPAVS